MARNDLHNGHLAKLQEEIRKQGVPYDSGEPDPLYWANFRVRVMEQIEANESRKPAALWRRAQEWIADHVMGASIATSAAAFVVAMLVMVHPFDVRKEVSNPVAAMQQQPKVVVPQPAPAEQNSLAVVTHQADPSDRSDKSYAAKRHESQENLAAVEALTNTEADDAVSLEELSTLELQSVLQKIKSAE
jgi:hypothetical protein